MLPVTNEENTSAESVRTTEETAKSETPEKKPLTISYVTGWPIDVIYGYLHKNYEGKGKRESLAMAQKKVREYKDSDGNYLLQDPHYWTGFVMLD